MTDPTKRKMKLPPWHLPYLEKHNVYKLFYELARELVVRQPDDHVFFVKYLLTSAVRNVRVPRVILLGSPRVDVEEVGRQIAARTRLFLVTGEMLLAVLRMRRREDVKPAEVVLAVQSVINANAAEIAENGWIMVDCVQTKREAQKLLDVGVLPTHVLYLISPYSPDLADLLYCGVSPGWLRFRRNMLGLTRVYAHKLIEVYLDDAAMEALVARCVELIYVERVERGPRRPRVLILGPRGSGRKTQARLIAAKLNLVHIDFEYVLCQEWLAATELGDELRARGDKACFDAPLLARVLNKRLLSADCLARGWVLTGYPFAEADMRRLDCLETPPNRVVFLECDLNVCLDRLAKRQINADTGSVTRLDAADLDADALAAKRLNYHPKDKVDLINAELQYYCTQYGALRKYCGGTATAVNADQPERWVYENVLAAVARDLPITSPRDPFAPTHPNAAEMALAMPYTAFRHD